MTVPAYEWVGNTHIYLAHSVPVHSYGLSSAAVCGLSVAHYEAKTKTHTAASVEAGEDRPRCGACSDILKVKAVLEG